MNLFAIRLTQTYGGKTFNSVKVVGQVEGIALSDDLLVARAKSMDHEMYELAGFLLPDRAWTCHPMRQEYPA